MSMVRSLAMSCSKIWFCDLNLYVHVKLLGEGTTLAEEPKKIEFAQKNNNCYIC